MLRIRGAETLRDTLGRPRVVPQTLDHVVPQPAALLKPALLGTLRAQHGTLLGDTGPITGPAAVAGDLATNRSSMPAQRSAYLGIRFVALDPDADRLALVLGQFACPWFVRHDQTLASS